MSQNSPAPKPDQMLASARDLSLGGLCIAMGIVVPMLFHYIGSPAAGKVFLPMFLPVLAAGLLVRPAVALSVGLITPLLSGLLTMMPPLVPMGVLMSIELAALAGVASLLRQSLRLNLWIALLGAMLASRAVFTLEVLTIGPLLGYHMDWYEAAVLSIAPQLPGIILQLTIVPLVVYTVDRRPPQPKPG